MRAGGNAKRDVHFFLSIELNLCVRYSARGQEPEVCSPVFPWNTPVVRTSGRCDHSPGSMLKAFWNLPCAALWSAI